MYRERIAESRLLRASRLWQGHVGETHWLPQPAGSPATGGGNDGTPCFRVHSTQPFPRGPTPIGDRVGPSQRMLTQTGGDSSGGGGQSPSSTLMHSLDLGLGGPSNKAGTLEQPRRQNEMRNWMRGVMWLGSPRTGSCASSHRLPALGGAPRGTQSRKPGYRKLRQMGPETAIHSFLTPHSFIHSVILPRSFLPSFILLDKVAGTVP